jgi:5-methylthioadenosine/S-adenosylhomocysteine deaminase
MTTSVLIRGPLVLDPRGDLHAPRREDILLHQGRIAARGDAAARMAAAIAGCETVEAADKLLTPGFVNAHYHSHDVLQRGLFEQVPLDVWSLHSFPSFYPRRPADEVALRTRVGAAECIRSGITTVQDMVTVVGPDEEHVQAIVGAYQGMGLRVCLALQIGDRPTIDTHPFWREMLPPRFADAYSRALSPGAMQALVSKMLRAPSHPRLDWALAPSTPERCSDDLLAWLAQTAQAEGVRVYTHLYESRAQAVLARVRQQIDGGSFVQTLRRNGLLREFLAVAHGIWITEREIDELAAAGVSLVSNPTANVKLLDGIAPVGRYLAAGVNVGLGGDNCSCSDVQNMFQAMKALALVLAYQTAADSGSAAEKAFRAATLGSAAALGLAGQAGCLDVGAHADVVLIDASALIYHPLHSAVRQLVYAETGSNVHTVFVGGAAVLRDGQVLVADEAALAAQADAAGVVLREEYQGLLAANAELLRHLAPIHKRVREYELGMDRLRLG